ncbi:hypothetical protein HN588_03790 [Candidatus Bathyarchaeota archaeon]|jgi:hypothetical protein|nr:hypothetical protein [Candidatus Bathyarchaeota archaeon]
MKIKYGQLKRIINEELVQEGWLDRFRKKKDGESSPVTEPATKAKSTGIDWREISKDQHRSDAVQNPRFAKPLSGGVTAHLVADIMAKNAWNLTVSIAGERRPLIQLKDIGYDVQQAKNFTKALLKSSDGKAPSWAHQHAHAWKKLYK